MDIEVNGVRLYYELHGEGAPLALAHGSWVDAVGWAFVIPKLAESFQVMIYDRRGHSRSERPDGQGSVHEDAEDLGALLEALELAPAHVVTHSSGGNIALRLAAKRPELFRSLCAHQPPLWDLLETPEDQQLHEQGARTEDAVGELIAAGDDEGGARYFSEEIFGAGSWETALPAEIKTIFVENAPTLLDELRDPDFRGADLAALGELQFPVLLTTASETSGDYARVIERLMEAMPQAALHTFDGAAPVPQLSMAEPYAELLTTFAREADASAAGRT